MNLSADSTIALDNVDTSFWRYVRHHHLLECVLMLPLVGGWEYIVIRYIAPVIYTGHVSGSSTKGFVSLLAIPLILVSLWYYRLLKKYEDAFLSGFAVANGYSFDPVGSAGPAYGSIFRADGNAEVSDVVAGTYQQHDLRLFLCDVVVGSGRSQRTYRNTVMELTLPGKVPAMLLTAKHARNFGLNLAALSGIDGTISLEGDFNQYFTLHAATAIRIAALEVFTPDVMAVVEDHSRGYSIEFIADKIYIYEDNYINKREDLEGIFELAKLLLSNLAAVSERLAAYSEIPNPPVNVTGVRSHLSRRLEIAFYIVGALFVLVAVVLLALGTKGQAQTSATSSGASSDNVAYSAAATQAEADIAASENGATQGAQVVADGQRALAASRTSLGRSGAYYYIGIGLHFEGDDRGALAQEMNALNEDPNNSAAIITAGDLLVDLDRPGEAIVMAARETALDPADSGSYRIRAFAEANLGQNKAALADMDQAIKIDTVDTSKQQYLHFDAIDRGYISGNYARPLRLNP